MEGAIFIVWGPGDATKDCLLQLPWLVIGDWLQSKWGLVIGWSSFKLMVPALCLGKESHLPKGIRSIYDRQNLG